MLEDGCVADSNGSGVLIAGQVREFLFRQVPFAPYAIHYLQIFRIARERTQKPVAPLQGFGFIAVRQHGFECQGCIAQPAVAVVPVAWSANSSGREVVGAATMPPVS